MPGGPTSVAHISPTPAAAASVAIATRREAVRSQGTFFLKILFVTEYFHPFTPGGTPWSLRILGSALARIGEQVAVVTPNYGASARETIDGIEVFRFPFWRSLPPGASLAPVRDHVRPAFHAAVARAVRQTAAIFGADVVHVQEKHSLVGAFLSARRLRLPVVLSLRDYGLLCPIATCLLSRADVPRDCGSVKLQRHCAPEYLDLYIVGSWRHRLRVRASLAALYLDAQLKAAVVRRVDAVVGVSGGVLDVYRSARRLRAGQGRVLHNPASSSAQAAPVDRAAVLRKFDLPDRPVVLFVGKRSPGKGFSVFLDAARQIAARIPAAQFVAVGDGPPAGLPEGVDLRILGQRSHAEVELLHAAADVFVHAAVWPEPLSRAMLEAAAAGTAIVATRTGGTSEVIDDGVTGLLVPPRDPTALAEAVAELLRDPARRASLGARARETVGRRFAPEQVARDLLALYREVTAHAS